MEFFNWFIIGKLAFYKLDRLYKKIILIISEQILKINLLTQLFASAVGISLSVKDIKRIEEAHHKATKMVTELSVMKE